MIDALACGSKFVSKVQLRRKMIGAVEAAKKQYQKNPARNNRNILRLASKASIFLACLSNFYVFLNWGNTLFASLWCGGNLTIKVEIPSLEILMETELEEAEQVSSLYDQLKFIEEKRLTSLCRSQCYQKRMTSKRTPEENLNPILKNPML